MELKNLINRIDLTSKSKLEKYHNQFTHFIDLLRTRNLNETTISEINKQIDLLNSLDSKDKSLKSQYRKSQGNLLRLLTKEHNLVTQNYYRNTWMMIGMGAIGVPIGTALGVSSKNMGLIGIGLPIGMAIGIAVGVSLDKKAEKSGNQLDIEIKY